MSLTLNIRLLMPRMHLNICSRRYYKSLTFTIFVFTKPSFLMMGVHAVDFVWFLRNVWVVARVDWRGRRKCSDLSTRKPPRLCGLFVGLSVGILTIECSLTLSPPWNAVSQMFSQYCRCKHHRVVLFAYFSPWPPTVLFAFLMKYHRGLFWLPSVKCTITLLTQ